MKIQGLAAGQSNVVALLAPADSHLTQRTSCYLNQLSGSQTTFTFIPLGKYRVFVFDAQFQSDVSAYAPLPGFLKNEAASVEVSDDQTADTAFYLEEGTVKNAIQQMRLSVHVNTR